MDIFKMRPSDTRHTGPSRPPGARRSILTLSGGAAFWLSNLAISMTPIAAEYRLALSISYVPMLLEAAVGGLLVAGAVALLFTRFPNRVPGRGPLSQATLLAVVGLLLITALLEAPTKLGAELAEPGRWLLVATVFNTIRFLALGVTIGLIAKRASSPVDRPHEGTRRKVQS